MSRVHYLCHWQGYSTDADTYEPLDNIPQQARAMVNQFNKRQPSAKHKSITKQQMD